MRPLLLASLALLSACAGTECKEGMARTCRLLGGSPTAEQVYRSDNPAVLLMLTPGRY